MSKIGEWFASWKLVSWRSAIVLVLVLYVLIGFLVVPWVTERILVNTAQEKLGRVVTVEKIECNPFTLSLTIRGLTFPDRPGSTMLSFDELYANAQVSSLFRWAFTLKELRIDGLYSAVRRFEDREVNILELAEALDTGEEPKEPFVLPRALFHKIEVNGGRFDFEDRAREAPLMRTAEPIKVLLTDISTLPDEQGDNDITISQRGGGTLRIRGQVTVEPLGLEGAMSLDQVQLARPWGLVADKFELSVTDGIAEADINYSVRLGDEGLHVEIRDSEFRVSDFAVRAPIADRELIKADSVVVSNVMARWPEQEVRVDTLAVDGASAFLWLEPDGTPSWNVLVPKPTQEQIAEAYRYVEERVTLDAMVGRFEVKNASALFEDRTFDEPVMLEVTEADLELTDVSTEQGSVWGIAASAAVGEGSRAGATGTLVAMPLTLDAEVDLEGLRLDQFQAYVARYAPLDLQAGILSTSGSARLAPKDEAGKITFNGELGVESLNLYETVTEGPLLGWGDLNVSGIQAILSPTSLDVEEVDISNAGLEIAVAEDGTINLLEFFKALGEAKESDAGTAAEGEGAEDTGMPPIHVARLQLHDCYGRYTDATTVEPFERKIESVNGTISNIATESAAGADLAIDAAVDSGGMARVEGELDLFDYQRLTDVAVDIQDVPLPPMSPLSIKMIGFPIDSGSSSLELDYQIHDRQLVSTNHVEIADLQLGEKVEGQGDINLPVKLGVSLLKDSNGVITLDVPIEGDLDNPDFVMTSAVAAAAKDLVGEVAKAPFRVLGRLGGGSDDEDLEYVGFEAGTSILDPRAISNLSTLAKALGERPNLGIEIRGTVDSVADDEAFRQLALVESVGAEEVSFPELETSYPIGKLESQYKKQLPAEQMRALRAEHTSGEEAAVDEVAYRRALVAELLEAQSVDTNQVAALGPARAEAIQSFLVDQARIDPSRVTLHPEPTTSNEGDHWVRCQLEVSAGS
jgi:hypothetical protein